MTDFSIEAAAERIVDPRSKEHFREVFSSYVNGNYRSAVVMLWSVVICDLLFKLDELKSKNDPAALSIATAIEKKQQQTPTSPEWERLLVELLKEKTHLIDAAEFVNIDGLQKHRHLSAHPVLSTHTYTLFTPTKELVRSYIRTALDAVLTKPALMSRKIFDAFTVELERLAMAMPYADPEDAELGRYLEATMFGRLSPTVAEPIFRSL